MGAIFKVPAYIIFAVGGLWGFFICLGIIHDAVGFVGTVIALFLLPLAVVIAPWYAAIALGKWLPLGLIYGSGFLAAVLHAIGAAIDRD